MSPLEKKKEVRGENSLSELVVLGGILALSLARW